MPDYYGLPQAYSGGVPAGGDANVGYLIMQAPIDAHMRIVAIDYTGGDASEDYHLFIWPAGTSFPTDATNAICVCSGAITGGESIQTSLQNNLTRQSPGWWLIPAGWTLGVIPISAGSSAAFDLNVCAVPMAVN
jgi:hypothetical protein